MQGSGLSRRGFLSGSLGAMAAAGFPAWYARELLAAEQESASRIKKVGPNGKITFGLVGCGGMGHADVGRFRGRPDCQIVAVCDVDKNHLMDAAKKYNLDEKSAYKDFRDLVARKDIDFVIVATPDHWHTLASIAAMKNGKDVYCEKPLTLTIEEGKAMVKVARDNKRILQTGSQQRSEGHQWRLACELVRNGRLGKLKTIETWIGANPKGGPFKTEAVPEGLDWDFWQGQTPNVPYIKQRCHYEFRWWYEYSGGKMTDWGAHHNDIAQWALGMDDSGPVTIESVGDAPASDKGSYNCHPNFKVTYTYGNGVKVICQSKENGVRFEGEDGKWIFVNREFKQFRASDGDAKISKIINEPLSPSATRLEVSTSHGNNFIDCIKSRKQPITNVEVGHRSVSVCHLGVISLRMGGDRLQWDPAEEKFTGNGCDEANKWLRREMRAPWKLEA